MALPIDRVTSDEFSKSYFPNKQPAIITDVIPKWKAYGKWSPVSLGKLFQDNTADVAVSRKRLFDYNVDGSNLQENRRMPFSELISRITAPRQEQEHCYLTAKSVPHEFPDLLPDFQIPSWIGVSIPVINLWVGAAENRTPLHYDLSNNFFAQMYGSKRFSIFDPAQTPYLYPYPLGQNTSHFSPVDIDAPDLVAHPDFRKSRALTFTVAPGELLFLPAYWWHHVTSVSVSISLNFWWPPDFQQHLTTNAVRQLWVDYERDRLRAVKEALLAPNKLNWFDAANLIRPIEKRGAVLLMGAAIEEFVRDLYVKSKLSDRAPAPPLELDAACSQLQAAGRLSEHHSQNILAWNAVVSRVRQGLDVTDDEVSTIIAGVRRLLAAAA